MSEHTYTWYGAYSPSGELLGTHPTRRTAAKALAGYGFWEGNLGSVKLVTIAAAAPQGAEREGLLGFQVIYDTLTGPITLSRIFKSAGITPGLARRRAEEYAASAHAKNARVVALYDPSIPAAAPREGEEAGP